MKNQTHNLLITPMAIALTLLFCTLHAFAQSTPTLVPDEGSKESDTGIIILTGELAGGTTEEGYCASVQGGNIYSGFSLWNWNKQIANIEDIQISTNVNSTVIDYDGHPTFQPFSMPFYSYTEFHYDLYYTIPNDFTETGVCIYIDIFIEGNKVPTRITQCLDFCSEEHDDGNGNRIAQSSNGSINTPSKEQNNYKLGADGGIIEEEEEEEDGGIIILEGELAGGTVDPTCLSLDWNYSYNFKFTNTSQNDIVLTQLDFANVPQEFSYNYLDLNGIQLSQGVHIPSDGTFEFQLDFILESYPPGQDSLSLDFNIAYHIHQQIKPIFTSTISINRFVCEFDYYSDGGGSDDGTSTTNDDGGKNNKTMSPSLVQINDLDISPNPSIDKININYTIHEESQVNIDIYDQTGRKIISIVNSRQDDGTYTLQYPYPDDFQPGVYYVIYRTENQIKTEKIIKF